MEMKILPAIANWIIITMLYHGKALKIIIIIFAI